jgi:hypothetical protein
MGMGRGPLSFVGTIKELLEGNSTGSGLENRDYGRTDSSRRPRGTLYPQKLTLTSLTSCGRSVGIVRKRTQATEFFFCEEVGLEINVEKTKHMLQSRHQNAGQNRDIQIANRSFENVSQL